jgi:hypothetical protein
MLLATAPLAWALAQWFTEPANRWLRGAEMAKASTVAAAPDDIGVLVRS